MGAESVLGKNYERNSERVQDIQFIRTFLQQMDQSRTMRWRSSNEASFSTTEEVMEMKESDAEHTGQMNMLATCIRLKAKEEGDVIFDVDFDMEKVRAMVGMHDIEENLIGDARIKNASYRALENNARTTVFTQLSTLNFGESLRLAHLEYLDKSSKEAQFVKALDEMQAWFYLIYTKQFSESTRNFKKPTEIEGYVFSQKFPTLKRIADILLFVLNHPSMIQQGIVDLELIKEQYKT